MRKQQPRKAPGIFAALADALETDWRRRARPTQIPPDEFNIFGLLTGRGFGKNWMASHFIDEQARTGGARRIALVGPTWDHVRMTMIEGESGVLAASPPWARPQFEASKSMLTWPNGAQAFAFSADQCEALRGPEHDLAWADELASWRRPEAWSNLLLTLRIGKPRLIVTTTPKPTRLIRDLVARDGQDGVIIRRGATYENKANLAPQFLSALVRKFEGTRLARQELQGELLTDTPGALWTYDLIEATRVASAPASLSRIVVAVDPSGSDSEQADECGIVVAGVDGSAPPHGYILADLSAVCSPNEWARLAVNAYRSYRADLVICEQNFGGQMASSVLKSLDPNLPVKNIVASRSKILRAEPIAALFEQHRAHIVGVQAALEDELTRFTHTWDRTRDGSPNRLDAAVFALTELMGDGADFSGWLELLKWQAARDHAHGDSIAVLPGAVQRSIPEADGGDLKKLYDATQEAALTESRENVCARCGRPIEPGTTCVSLGGIRYHPYCIDSFTWTPKAST